MRDSSYFHNPVHHSDPYDLQRVNWDVRDRSQIDGIRNQNQTNAGAFVSFLNQAIIGEFVGGMLQGFGALVDLIGVTGERDFQNFLTDWGDDLQQWTQDVTPIFTANPQKGWDPSDRKWWMQGFVSVASGLSLLIPAAGVVKGVSYAGRAARYGSTLMRTAGATSKLGKKSLRYQLGNGMVRATNLGGKKMRTRGKILLGGTTNRYMENFREAGEVGLVSYDRNLEFFQDDAAWERFLTSKDGVTFLNETGSDINDKLIKEKAAQWVAGNAAHKTFHANWANLAFDILQYGLIFRGFSKFGKSTRGKNRFKKHPKNVRKAQNAMLKNPKIPKTRLGRLWKNWGAPTTKFAAWSYSEGMEEQINFIAMQEGIRHGDIMAGNTGLTNLDWVTGGYNLPTLWDRTRKYNDSGEYWAATMFGSFGGAAFTGVANIVNKKREKAIEKRRIEEIGKRQEFIQNALRKREAAFNKGDTAGVKEQNKLLAINLGLNAAQVGNVDLLLEQINDENFDEMLLSNGIKKEDLDSTKKEIIDIVLQAEKRYENYANKILGNEYASGAARAITELEMSMDMYSELIEDIDKQIEENQESTKLAEQKAKIGPNTKNRRELNTKKRALEETIKRVETIIQNLENDNADPNTSREDKRQNEATIASFKQLVNNYKNTLKSTQSEQSELKNNSKETYTEDQFNKEEEYLSETNRNDVVSLENKKLLYEAHRAASWRTLNKILSSEYEFTVKDKSDKVEDALVTEKERKEKIKIDDFSRSEIEGNWSSATKRNAQDAENDAVIQDFQQLLSYPETDEDAINLFLQDYTDNQYVIDKAKKLLRHWRSRKEALELQAAVDELRNLSNKIDKKVNEGKDIEDTDKVMRDVMRLLNIIWGVEGSHKDSKGLPLTKEEENKKKRSYDWGKQLNKFIARYKYGIPDSLNWNWMDLFDEFVPNVQVMWGNRIGVIYRKNNTLYFQDETQHETAVVSTNNRLYDLDMIVLKNSTTISLNILHDGRTFDIEGNYFSNTAPNPTDAIEYTADGQVKSVSLNRWDGKYIKITTPGIILDLARAIETMEAVKRANFDNLVGGKAMLVGSYIVRYEQTDLFSSQLVVRDKSGKRITGKIGKKILHIANKRLSQSIEKEINNLITKLNESITTYNVTPSEITKETLSGPSGRTTKVSKESQGEEELEQRKAEEKLEAEVQSESSGEVNVEKVEMSEDEKNQIKNDISTKGYQKDKNNADVLHQKEQKLQDNEFQEDTGQSVDDLIKENEDKTEAKKIVDIIDSSINQQEPGIPKPDVPSKITNPTVTSKNVIELNKTYPQAWTPQYKSLNLGTRENPLHVSALDVNGNAIPEFMRSGNKAAYRILPMSMLNPGQLENIDKESPAAGRIISLWYNEPRVGEGGQIVREGNRIIVNKEKQLQFKIINKETNKPEPAVMVIYPGSIKTSEVIDFDIANSPNTGVGTKVILRVEPNFEYYKSNDPNKVIITVRLASDPNIIISQMRGGTAKFKQNLILRKNVVEALKGNRSVDIKAEISGKTDGFITNLKRDGKSIKQPLSILKGSGFEIILGYGQNGTIRTNNSDISVSNSSYVENGTIYIIMPSSSGRMVPVRVETSNLSMLSAKKIISILSDTKLTEEQRRDQVNKIVNVYGKLEEDTELALDNYRIKFPYKDSIIGLQIHPEGSDNKSNFQKFIDGEPFKFIKYDSTGKIITSGKITKPTGEVVENILRDSKELGDNTLSKKYLLNYLITKKYNVQGHEINTTDPYVSPINNKSYDNYLEYLSDPNLKILSTDVLGGRASKFNHSIIYTEITDDTTSIPFNKADLTVQEMKEFSNASLDEGVVKSLENEAIMSIDDLIEKQGKDKTKNDIDNIDDINLPEIKLREASIITGPTYNIVTDEEIDWFKEKFGEAGLSVLERVKWIRVSKGRNAWGFYQNGLVTIAREGKEGTAYWEAFRRVFDIHLSENEKTSILMDASSKWGDNLTEEELETKLAGYFMDYMLNEKDPSFTGKIKQFFKELMYVIKNFLGLNNSIDRIFRNIRDTKYKNYTAEELNKLSQVDNIKLRQMYNKNGDPMPQEFVEEVVGNINHDLYYALQSKAKVDGVSFESYLKDPKKLDAFYEAIRQQYKAIGEKILDTAGISDRVKSIGENYLRIVDDSLWGIRTDALHNLTSPGFKKLAIQNLQPLFGVKYTTYRGQEITDDQDANEINDIIQETEPKAQERIHGINFYYRPIKDTLSKDVKIGLSFIESEKKGKVLGKHRFVPFNDVYNYLALNLSNVPEGKVVEKLKTLNHELVPQVLEKYTSATKAWKNKFVSHFNKQNIAFKTLVIENNGSVKVMYTNRNGLERQIINEWRGNRYDSKIFVEVLGENDKINIEEAKKIQKILEKELVSVESKYRRISNPKAQQVGKKEYMVSMVKVLKSLGIVLPQNMRKDLFNDNSVTVSDLHTYMYGPNSIQYIFKNLTKDNPISPYMASNAEMGALGKLAKFVTGYKVDSYLSSFIGGNRKSIYSINLNTFDSERTLSLRSPETSSKTIERYFEDIYYKPNSRTKHLILDLIQKNKSVRDNFQLSTFDVVKEKGNFGRATAYDRMTENLSALSRFSMFNNSGSRYGEFSTGTKSDKGQFKFISLPKIHPKNKGFGLWKSGEIGTIGYIETAVALLRPLVLMEYARISKTERQLYDLKIPIEKQIKNLHYKNSPGDLEGNGLKFMIFRDFNKIEAGLFHPDTNRLLHIYDGNQQE